MCKAYGFHFGHTLDMDIGLKYQALKQKQIDVMIIFTTDGQLEDPDIVVLDDDLHFSHPIAAAMSCGEMFSESMLN